MIWFEKKKKKKDPNRWCVNELTNDFHRMVIHPKCCNYNEEQKA